MAKKIWTREETKLLIERVEEMPELWNISGQTNKDRVKKTAAIESLAEQFHIDSAEINRKLHNLRTQLNNELRKMRQKKSGQGADETYKSSWEYFEMIKFMIPENKLNETHSNLVSFNYLSHLMLLF